MAKQTFTTGQVLTAAQMTSLQQTAMGGGSATAKTASYVLVAADAGTTVAMNAAGSTTITVNTGLFAAGDTVFIQNLGAGACTVTAGTATVATAGSLILPQNDAGILYFTATGAAIFYDYIQAGAVSPLTTKGDVYTFSTSDARLGVGANNTVLTADSAEATGLKWATPAAGGMTLLSTNTFANTSTSHTISGIDGNYKHLLFIGKGFRTQGNDTNISFRFNSDTGSVYYWSRWLNKDTTFTATVGDAQSSLTSFVFCNNDAGISEAANFAMWVYRYTDTDNVSGQIYGRGSAVVGVSGVRTNNSSYFSYDCSAAITSITLFSTNNITGTLYIYGVS